MSQFERGLEFCDNEDYVMLEGPWKFNVFLPNQVAIVKELLEEVKVFEQSTRPIRSVLQYDKEKLENEAIKLSSNLWDRKELLEKEKTSLIKMETKLEEN